MPPPDEPLAPPGGHQVLLVEDSNTQALRIEALLDRAGLAVRRVASAEAALDALNDELPDAILLDFHLPGMAGDELCRRLRSSLMTRELPVLMLTGSGTDSLELTGLDSGVDDYVPKSADPEVLLARLRVLLRRAGRRGGAGRLAADRMHSARLLVVDDSPTYLELIGSELREDGYVVDTCTSGQQAVARVEGGDYDGVLVDLVMPGPDGIEVCRRLTEHRRRIDGTFVLMVLTAEESREALIRALDAGADDYLVKAADLTVVRGRVRSHLRRKFLHEDHRRVLAAMKERELATLKAEAEREAAQARAALADQLEAANRDLEGANRRLRETQSQLVQSEKMASLGQLVAGIAHEINNPLSFVGNNIYTVQRDLRHLVEEVGATLSDDGRRRLERATRRLADMRLGVDRVRDLVLKLRTFSRLDEGRFKTVDIHESLEAVLLFLNHKVEGRIDVERRYGAPRLLSCYAGELNQVFMNLLSNAVDAIDGAGTITLTTTQEDGCFRLDVEDTGRGIPDDLRPRIFEPFYTTKPVGQGTGLGLAISYRIVEAHRGRIEAHPRQDGGTRFTVHIPLDLGGETQ